jgi:hypothetical protein
LRLVNGVGRTPPISEARIVVDRRRLVAAPIALDAYADWHRGKAPHALRQLETAHVLPLDNGLYLTERLTRWWI